MTKKIRLFSLTILLLVILGITACGGNKDAGRFVGSWKCFDSKGNATTITFNADGTWTRHVVSTVSSKGTDYTGKYKIDPLPDSRVTYTTDVFYHYILTDDMLTLTGMRDSAETAEVYKRVK